jgi:hypothetical protein
MANYHPANKEHVIKYWKGMLGNPGEHDSPDIVFLKCNVNGGSDTRNLGPISKGKKIFVPVNPVAVTEDEKPGKNKQQRKKFAEDDENSASKAILTIDGNTYHVKEKRFRQDTDDFDVGSCKAVADGFYVIIDPLPVGQHTVRFQGRVEHAEVGTTPWEQDVTYNIEVR